MTTELIEILPLAELEKISATDDGLLQLRGKALELSGRGIPATSGDYDEVHAATMVCVKVRTGAVSLAKTLAAPYKYKYDAILAEGRRIGADAAESESLLRPLKAGYEAQQEQIRIERERAEAARIAARIDSLYTLGATYNGLTYNVYGVLIDAVEVQALPDAEWNDLYDSAAIAYEKDRCRLELIEIEKQAEIARLEIQRQEQQTEAARLQATADEQVEGHRRLLAEKAAFEQQQADAKVVRLRAERAEEQRLEAERLRQFELAQRDFQLQQEAKERAEWEAEQLRLEKQAEADEKARKKSEEFLRKENKERHARLKTDKKIIRGWAIQLGNFPKVEATQPETAELLTGFLIRLSSLAQDFAIEVDAL